MRPDPLGDFGPVVVWQPSTEDRKEQGLKDTVLLQRQMLDRYRMHLALITKPGYQGVIYEVV